MTGRPVVTAAAVLLAAVVAAAWQPPSQRAGEPATAGASAADLAGWIANELDPQMERRDENFALLSARMPVACWGRLPHAPEAGAVDLATYLLPP